MKHCILVLLVLCAALACADTTTMTISSPGGGDGLVTLNPFSVTLTIDLAGGTQELALFTGEMSCQGMCSGQFWVPMAVDGHSVMGKFSWYSNGTDLLVQGKPITWYLSPYTPGWIELTPYWSTSSVIDGYAEFSMTGSLMWPDPPAPPAPPVPEPASLLLLGTGLTVAGSARRWL